MDYQDILTACLTQLPALGLGFLAGMIFQRGNYLRVIKWMRVQIARQQRQINSMIGPWR